MAKKRQSSLLKWCLQRTADKTRHQASCRLNSPAEIRRAMAEMWLRFGELQTAASSWHLVICEFWPEIGMVALYPATLGRYLGDAPFSIEVGFSRIAKAYKALPDPEETPDKFEIAYEKITHEMVFWLQAAFESKACQATATQLVKRGDFSVYMADSPEEVRGDDLRFLFGKRVPPKRLKAEPKATTGDRDGARILDKIKRRSEKHQSFCYFNEASGLRLTGPLGEIIPLLAQWTNLPGLDVSDTRLSDAQFAKLSELDQLKRLDVGGTRITDKSLRVIGKMQTLLELFLSGLKVTDLGLRHIARLPLITLALNDCPITDRGLETIVETTSLTRLALGGTKITDVGLVHLTKLPLEWVNVLETNTTLDGLACLHKIRTLKTLMLPESLGDAPGAKQFINKFRNCRATFGLE